MRGLYIHIPFCKTICSYCDFPKQMAKEEVKERYIDFLIQEIDSYHIDPNTIQSVYIGGGTPNSLSNELLEKLFKHIHPYLAHSLENTIELNAELFTEEQAKLFKKYNIQRVSIGVQTFQNHLIKNIKRHHSYDLVLKSIDLLHKNHIQNINLDMIFGIPEQTLKDLKADINLLLGLPITHVSYYSLILEEKTLLEYQLKHHQITLPEDDLVADMHDYLHQRLKKAGFHHYEISNYAKSGFESIHNLTYWDTLEYIGVGASAAGYIDKVRYQNEAVLSKYYDHIVATKEEISTRTAKQEFMMLGLRKIDGVSIKTYFERFKTYPKDDFELDSLINQGLIEVKNGIIKIKEEKIFISNLVFEKFVG